MPWSPNLRVVDGEGSLLSHKQEGDDEENFKCTYIWTKVENEVLVFPEGMSEKARDFIDKLIRKNPGERIKASEALLHPFLEEREDDR